MRVIDDVGVAGVLHTENGDTVVADISEDGADEVDILASDLHAFAGVLDDAVLHPETGRTLAGFYVR